MKMVKSRSLKKYLGPSIIICLVNMLFPGCRLQGVTTTGKTLLNKQYICLNDSIYADKFELTIAEYKVFLADVKNSNPSVFQQYIIDSDAWNNYPDARQAHLSKNYFSHPAFNNYPVCCISWQAANLYCQWLTDKNNAKNSRHKLIFRLPAENEWLLLVAKPNEDGLDTPFPKGYNAVNNHYQFNYNNNDTINNKAKDGGWFTVAVNLYPANRKDILNLHGNVAEMTSNPGICKGGGWNDDLQNCSVYVRKHYSLPSAEVGVRIFAVLR